LPAIVDGSTTSILFYFYFGFLNNVMWFIGEVSHCDRH
jgi:hypothetical protein